MRSWENGKIVAPFGEPLKHVQAVGKYRQQDQRSKNCSRNRPEPRAVGKNPAMDGVCGLGNRVDDAEFNRDRQNHQRTRKTHAEELENRSEGLERHHPLSDPVHYENRRVGRCKSQQGVVDAETFATTTQSNEAEYQDAMGHFDPEAVHNIEDTKVRQGKRI